MVIITDIITRLYGLRLDTILYKTSIQVNLTIHTPIPLLRIHLFTWLLNNTLTRHLAP